VRVVAPDVLIFAVPNGGLRSKTEAPRLKWTGVIAGIPVVIAPIGRVFFLEVKTSNGRLSNDQQAIFDALAVLGAPFMTVRSIDVRRAFSGRESRLVRRVMFEREGLPNRRAAELIDFEQDCPSMLRGRCEEQAVKQAEPGDA
jgi:hypothetical protein